MAESVTSAPRWGFLGGHLCLDFANTVDWHASDRPEELLTSYGEFVEWSQRAGILTEEQAQSLLRQAAERSDAAEVVLK